MKVSKQTSGLPAIEARYQGDVMSTYRSPIPSKVAKATFLFNDIVNPRTIESGNKASAKSKKALYAPPNVAIPA